ncbi:MAG: (d)CMP kinase [Janthinobacterium lividum]
MFTITIDGPAGVGKGTLARHLSAHYNLALLETGLLYRCVGMIALKNQVALDDEEKLARIASQLTPSDLAQEGLRLNEVSQAASQIAVFHDVRQALFHFQREFSAAPPLNFSGTILDGRDTGTVICPDAPIKFFIHAQVEIRAQRRFKELQNQGIESIYTTVLQDMIERDTRDQQRAEAPLKAASDALVIDTSFCTPEDVLNQAIDYVEMRRRSEEWQFFADKH